MSTTEDEPFDYFSLKRYKELNLVLCDLFGSNSDYNGFCADSATFHDDTNCTLRFESNRIDSLNKEWKVAYPSYNLLSKWRVRLNSEQSCITHLDLDSSLPSDATAKSLYIRLVCSLSELRVLSLRDNQLTHNELTNHIGCLSHLTELQLAMNNLTILPYGLKFCRQLCVLGLESNQFAALPYFLREMPELQTVRRFGNNFNDSYSNLRAAMETRLRPTRTSQNNGISTLCQLAEATVLSSGLVFGTTCPPLPDFLLEKVCSCSSLLNGCYPCDICHKAPLQNPLSLIIFPENFIGILMPPVCVTVCDLLCARSANELSFQFSSLPPVALNVVTINRRNAVASPMNPSERRQKKCNRLFGCCWNST